MNEEQLQRQRWLRYALYCFIGFLFFGFSAFVIMDYLEQMRPKNEKYSTTVNLPLDGVDPKEIWVDQIRAENEIVQNQVGYLEDMFVKRLQDEGKRDQSTQSEVASLRKEIDNLKSELLNKQQNPEILRESLREELHSVSSYKKQEVFDDPFFPQFTQEVFVPLASVSSQETTNLHHIKRTIPTGTTVKAILLSSIDMPCGVNGSSDPLPVKLRIIADGRLPLQLRARLKHGVVTASAYGDLSSERVIFRLEKLSQVRSDGHFIETQVAGYITGEDGKYGLRGTVVDKSACLVEQALLSGFLSGASNFFEAAAAAKMSPFAVYQEGNQPSWKQTAGQLGIAGGTGGITNALDVLTDYFIKRAEQLRPIIQITPGRLVDITFSDSADLGDLYTHERVRNSGRKLCNQ